MRVVNQSTEVLNISHDNPLEFIERAARNCYKSEYKGNPEFIRSLIKQMHFSVLEHVSVSVRLITDRSALAQLTRHRTGISFSVESGRYVNYEDGIEVILPVEFYPEDIVDDRKKIEYMIWYQHMQECEKCYADMKRYGASNQLARSVLPTSLSTNIVFTANLRELRHIFELRCSKKAQPLIRSLFIELLTKLNKAIPVVFEDQYKEYVGESNV